MNIIYLWQILCICVFVLRECARSLASPISVIYQESHVDRIYPTSFKLGPLCPEYKDGKKTDITNYRGVVVMQNLAKVFQSIVYTQVKLIMHPHIGKRHGSVSTRNIETNLMEFCNYAHSAFEQNAQVDTFYSDVKKAFHTVDQPWCI